VQNLTPLALSSTEKSVTVQTNQQTVNDISTPCLSACVDNNLQTRVTVHSFGCDFTPIKSTRSCYLL